MKYAWILIFCPILLLFAGSCRKDKFTDDPAARLSISKDTIQFDTIFTSIGSATKNFKIKNTNKNAVKISRIRLGNGVASQFRINLDGQAATEIKDKELAGGDSMYVFVEVTIDPNNINTPFIVTDSIIFETNGNLQDVKLVAFGQNAHFYTQKQYLPCNTTWTNDKPYVIYDSIGVAPGCTLTIEKGVKIYSHQHSFIQVDGTLIVKGTKDEPVIFRGTRMEAIYKNYPGQWFGLRISPGSVNNSINYAVIENCGYGFFTGVNEASDPRLFSAQPAEINIKNTIIRNCAAIGITSQHANINAENLLIYNCGQTLFYNFLGGTNVFKHCTFSNGNDPIFVRKYPSIVLTNLSLKDEQGTLYPFDANFQLYNSIIWGTEEEEISIEGNYNKDNSDSTFRNNLIRSKKMKFGASNLVNTDPKFKAAYKQDYHLLPESPAKDFGMDLSPAITKDLEDNSRNGKPDAGCYELQ